MAHPGECSCVFCRLWVEYSRHVCSVLLVSMPAYSVMSDSATPWTIACQTPLFITFPRQEYWSGLPFPPPGDLPDPGIKPISPALAGVFFTTSTTWEAPNYCLPVGFLRNSAISWQKWVVHLHLEQSCSFFFSFFLETTIVVWYAAEVLSANCLF